MSKSLKRVKAALESHGLVANILEVGQARTAAEAAASVGCELDQIAKSIIFQAEDSGLPVLFLTAGGNKVDIKKASEVAGTVLGKSDAQVIRSHTGFAIGGVAPIGHLSPIRAWMDPRLLDFSEVWGAAGTPRHVFNISPTVLHEISGAKITDFIA
ncbi:MAG: YbaK/EbsC family protein [Thalassococcus sp.]|uniref:YbaK/EbsC family protein n=1 Tax=Thalassococcus sp. TaxID=1928858 RepID=UPI001B1CD04F|nr:YbaK/EbsC family protein [Thalassococcus sp.]MBO6866878.1 YbaK/EbsC family protein [Thalassococcus sp.]